MALHCLASQSSELFLKFKRFLTYLLKLILSSSQQKSSDHIQKLPFFPDASNQEHGFAKCLNVKVRMKINDS